MRGYAAMHQPFDRHSKYNWQFGRLASDNIVGPKNMDSSSGCAITISTRLHCGNLTFVHVRNRREIHE